MDDLNVRYKLTEGGVLCDRSVDLPNLGDIANDMGLDVHLYDQQDFNNYFYGARFRNIGGRWRKFRFKRLEFRDELSDLVSELELELKPPAPQKEIWVPKETEENKVFEVKAQDADSEEHVECDVSVQGSELECEPTMTEEVEETCSEVVPDIVALNSYSIGKLRSKLRLVASGMKVYVDYRGKVNGNDFSHYGELSVVEPKTTSWHTDDGVIVRSNNYRLLGVREVRQLTELTYIVDKIAKSLSSTMSQWGVSASVIRAARAIKAQYRRFYEIGVHEEAYIDQYASSLQWMQYIVRDNGVYANAHFTALKNALSVQGYDARIVDRKVERRHFWARLRYKAKKIIAYGLTFGLIHKTWQKNKVLFKPTIEKCRVDIVREMRDKVIGNAIGMIPASRLAIAHVVASLDRPQNQVNKIADYSPTDLQYDGKETKIYGTTVNHPMIYPSSCVQNMDVAVSTRMGFQPPATATKYINQIIDSMHRLDEEFGVMQINDNGFENFLRTQYGPKRFEELMKHRDEPIEDKDLTTSMFIKNEAYVGKTYRNFRPRMIWGVNEKFTAHYGNLVNKVTKIMKDKWHKDWHNYFVCGATPDEIGEFVDRCHKKHKYMLMWDSSAFSGHLWSKIVQEENQFFGSIDGMPKEYKIDMDRLDGNGLRGKYIKNFEAIKVKLKHGGPDGKLTTCSRNTRFNVAMIRWLLDDFTENTSVMALGDDGVAFTNEHPDLTTLKKKASLIGFDIDFKIVDNPTDLEFCSGYFVPVAGKIRYCNKPMRCLMKFGVNYNNHPPKLWRRLLYGIAKGMLPTAGHAPIFGAILRAIIRDAENAGLKAYYDNKHLNPYRIQGGVVMEPDQDTYEWFAAKYRLSVELLKDIDQWLYTNVNLDSFPAIFDGPVIKQMAQLESSVLEQDFADAEMRNETLRYETINDLIVTRTPVVEELEKLANAVDSEGKITLINLLKTAWNFGNDEDALAGTNSHAWLHALFSFVTFFDFNKGVYLHAMYNRWALNHNGVPCSTRTVDEKKEDDKRSKAINSFNKKAKAPSRKGANFGNLLRTHNLFIEPNHDTAAQLRINGLAYEAALRDPWDAPIDIRIPDSGSVQTATITGLLSKTDKLAKVAGSHFVVGVLVRPYCTVSSNTKIQTISGGTSKNAITWATSIDDTAITTLTADAEKVRTVCMGVTLYALGKNDELDTDYYVGYCTAKEWEDGVLDDIDNVITNENFQYYNANDMMKGVKVTWRPANHYVTHDASQSTVPASVFGEVGTLATEFDESEIFIACIGDASATTSGGLRTDVITRYEYEPDFAARNDANTATAYSSPEALLEAQLIGKRRAQGSSRQMVNSAKTIVKEAWNMSKPKIEKLAAKGIKMLLPGGVQTALSAAPKSLGQIVRKVPVIGGVLGNLFSAKLRRMASLMGAHDKRLMKALAPYAEGYFKHGRVEDLHLIVDVLHKVSKMAKGPQHHNFVEGLVHVLKDKHKTMKMLYPDPDYIQVEEKSE